MSRLLSSEWRKVFTTKLWWGMLLGALAFSALGVVAQIASNGAKGNPTPPLNFAETQRSIASSATSGYIFAIIVGIIIITTEFRHFTSRPTFLLEPHRGRVIMAKMAVAAVVGLIYGVAGSALTAAIMIPWFAAKHVIIGWFDHDIFLVLVKAIAVVVIYSMVGVGIGAFMRNQIAAVIGTLAYLFVLEPLMTIIPFVKEIYRYLPGAAATAITAGPTRGGPQLLDPWLGGLVLLGWGLLLAVAGWVIFARRDIP